MTMDCQAVRELADSYLSDQLLVETNHELVRHLETCPACREELAVRRALREQLRTALANDSRLQPRPEFAAELARRLAPPSPDVAPVSRRDVLSRWAALAAGLVMVAGAGQWYRRLQRSTTALASLARQAAGDHQNCAIKFNLAEQPIPLEEAGRTYGAPYAAMATFELPELSPPARLLARHSCVFEGQRFAHMVFGQEQQVLSLLVTPEPAPPAVSRQAVDGGHVVVLLPAGRYLGFIVGAGDPERLVAVAESLVQPLARRLA